MLISERIPDYEEYKALRTAVGWRTTDETSTSRALENSLYSITISEEENIIAMGRIIGDGGLYFYIQDLLVQPDYQNTGLGKQIMAMLMAYLAKTAQTGAFIGLMAAPGLEHYYEKFGFTCGEEGGTGLYQFIQ